MKFGMFVALAIGCIVLSGCSAQIMEASQSACQSFGFLPGTDAYSQCVQQEAAMRDDAVNRAPLQGRGGVQGPQMPSSSAIGGVTPGVPVLKSSYMAGPKRVCLYTQSGHDVAVSVAAESVCPPTLQ